MKTFIK